jgi:hypothetical protein
MPLSFKAKREAQDSLNLQNDILDGNPSFAEKRNAQRQKDSLMVALGIIDEKGNVIGDETVEEPEEAKKATTEQLYDFDPNRKKSQRKKDNIAAMAILAQIDAGEIDSNSLTNEQKAALAKYSGTGGALVGADGKVGSSYEYYTPKPIASGMWDLARELGFNGGKVLDPSSGVGIFCGTAPEDAAVDAIELNETSGRINGLVNSGAGNSVTISAFEAVAANTPDNSYDAVITNVPFGDVGDRGGNQLLDKRYQKEPLQNYFILRSLEKLRPGGLAVFITPPRCVTGKDGKEVGLRQKASYMAEFLGAYRLPNSVFGTADADTITDVIAFRKYSAETLEKISELREQSPAILSDAKVLWDVFIEGNYFKGEGHRFVLGEFVPKDPDKFRDVDRVMNKAPVGEIASMLRKFPNSRINWDLLNTVETAPIVYQDGDTITQAGETLELRNGQWVALKKTGQDVELLSLLPTMTKPYLAFENKVSYETAMRVVNYMKETSQSLDIPGWLNNATSKLNGMPEYWWPGVVGLSVSQVLEENSGDQTNYLETYAALSDAMTRVYSIAKTIPTGLAGDLKNGLKTLFNHYNKKTGFSAVWRGDVLEDVQQSTRSNEQSFEGLRYQTKSIWVTIADAKQVMGQDFDPVSSSDYCLSGDGGSITKAGDYYVGNYGELLRKLDREIAAAPNDTVKAKLLRQKADASAYVDRIDTNSLTFNLFSPYVTIEEKAEFLRRFVDPRFAVSMERNGETVDKFILLDGKKDKDSDKDKLLSRMGQYLKNGTITLGGAKVSMSSKDALKELRKIVSTANEQFGPWVKSNKSIVERIAGTANDPDKLRFKPLDDESPMSIPGLSTNKTPHGYQYAFIRKMGREFGGINGHAVGLGKTLEALASVQHSHNIGIKKKTLFVVPNSVLSNWRKEATGAYENTDNCLYVGLRTNKTGKDVVQSSAYDADLISVMENRHSKIFVTMEAFERIRLKEETINEFGDYLRKVDSSFAESEKNAEEEIIKSKHASLMEILRDKSGSAPFLEDLGIDSIVIDEAHAMKNAASAVNTKSARFLSLSKPSARGFDAQAKAWYIRGQSPLRDGVLLLTATPITNSPLEIYSMLSLAVGHDRLNDSMVSIKGADDFLSVVCDVQSESDVSIDGIDRDINVFQGLNNVGMLRKSLNEIADIKDADDVGSQIVMPETGDQSVNIDLPDAINERLVMYKQAFRWAIDDIAGKTGIKNRGNEEAYDAVSAYFGEPMELIGHPFNLINKMTMLIADAEFDLRGTFYTFSDAQKALAEKAVTTFNAKKLKEKRSRPAPLTNENMIVGRKTIKDEETGDSKVELTIQIEATIQGNKNRIAIDTIDSTNQSVFEAIADKLGLNLEVSIPPKIAALLENVQSEAANPRGIDADGNHVPYAKQLIFCDILAMHNKIKRVLNQRAGIPANAIAVITGKTNNSPDEILDVQNGFNASGEDNKYRIIIANEKAEVGINLQIGTQAIHHLTIGWTPDSLTQRDGRGIRQGNKTERVNRYKYNANGTFDMAKVAMVSKKADWIDQVMDSNGGDKVAVTGGLSREQMEALIDVVGDADGMSRLQQSIASKEAESRATTNRDKQMVNISTVQKQLEFIKSNPDASFWAIQKIQSLYAMDVQLRTLKTRLANAKTETAAAKNQAAIADIQVRFDGLERHLSKAVTVKQYNSDPYPNIRAVLDAIPTFWGSRGDSTNDKIKNRLSGSVVVNPDSELQSDWQSEYDMAQSMIDESKAGFAKRAKDDGAYPASVIDAVAEGKAVVIFGKPVVVGAFVIIGDKLGVVDATYGSGKVYWNEGNYFNGGYIADAIKGNELIYPGTSAYTDALIRAATIEDVIADAGGNKAYYSDAVPEVKQYRKNVGVAEYHYQYNILPPPYFPVVMLENKAITPVTKAIFDSQKAIVKKTQNGYFTVSADVAVEKLSSSIKQLELLKDYAYAHGMQLVPADISGYFERFKLMIADAVNMDAFTAYIKNGTTEQGIKDNAKRFILDSLADWFDPLDRNILTEFTIPSAINTAIEDAIKEIRKSMEKPDDVVQVYGRGTYEWKETLKEYADKHTFPAYTKNYLWDKPNKVWLVSRAAWDAFNTDHPNVNMESVNSSKTL